MRTGARVSPSWPGENPPRPDTLKQTDHSAVSINPLADGAGHTFFEQSVFEGEIGDDLLQRCASRTRSFTSSEVVARAVSPASRLLPASRNSFDQPSYIDEAMPSRRHSSAMLSSPR